MGEYCTIHQCVTLGESFSLKTPGKPILGNHVVVFAGAKINGGIKVGDNAIIAANAVVTRDIPENSVAAGIPAKVVKNDTSTFFRDPYYRKIYAVDKQ